MLDKIIALKANIDNQVKEKGPNGMVYIAGDATSMRTLLHFAEKICRKDDNDNIILQFTLEYAMRCLIDELNQNKHAVSTMTGEETIDYITSMLNKRADELKIEGGKA